MEKLIKHLSSKIKITVAGTGTVYLDFNGKTIRISNHEPNESMKRFRGRPDFEIYTHDLTGNLINNKYEIVQKVANFYELPIKGVLKGILTKYEKFVVSESDRIEKLVSANKAFLEKLEQSQQKRDELILKAVGNNILELKKILEDANQYSLTASNGDKRRKKRRSYFTKAFRERFGFEAYPSEVDRLFRQYI